MFRGTCLSISSPGTVFVCLREPVFLCRHLFVATKQSVYVAVVLSTLLNGAETWTLKATHLRRSNEYFSF